MSNDRKLTLSISNYENLIFDCDGVILDSNRIKEDNIASVASSYLKGVELTEFIGYFNSNPGIPRESKIDKFVKDKFIRDAILNEYNLLNLDTLRNAKISDGLLELLDSIHNKDILKFIVSGADQHELLDVLSFKGIAKYFHKILGGPKSKYNNIDSLNIIGKSLYFGDSRIDYEVSEFYYFDFVHVTGYADREITFKNNSNIKIFNICNFYNLKLK